MSLSHSVCSQSGPPKSVGSGVGGRVGGRIPHFNWSIHRGGNFFFFLLFFQSGVKLDEESIENGLEVQKFLVVCLFWGGCHHPNIFCCLCDVIFTENCFEVAVRQDFFINGASLVPQLLVVRTVSQKVLLVFKYQFDGGKVCKKLK